MKKLAVFASELNGNKQKTTGHFIDRTKYSRVAVKILLALELLLISQLSLGVEVKLRDLSFPDLPLITGVITEELSTGITGSQVQVYRIRLTNSGADRYTCSGTIRFRDAITQNVSALASVSDTTTLSEFEQDKLVVAAESVLNGPVFHAQLGGDDAVSCSRIQSPSGSNSTGTVEATGPNSLSLNGDSAVVSLSSVANRSSSDEELYLVLWASLRSNPFSSGYVLGSSYLGVLGRGFELTDIERTIAARLPPPGQYYMHILVTDAPSVQSTVFDAVSFGLNTVAQNPAQGNQPPPGGVSLTGMFSYNIDLEANVVSLSVERIENRSNRRTGTLRLELWTSESPYTGGDLQGYRVAERQLSGSSDGQLPSNSFFDDVAGTVSIRRVPPDGDYYVSLILSEYTQDCGTEDGFCFLDYVGFNDLLTVSQMSGGGTVPPNPSINEMAGEAGGGGSLSFQQLGAVAILLLLSWYRRRILSDVAF